MTKPYLIVEARFYEDIADELVAGAVEALETAGQTYRRISVPGALEIAPAIALAARSSVFAGYLALGCVIRGETTHYDYVCAESARGLQDLAIQKHLAIGNGILTVENRAQAMARAKRSEKNKGADVAAAALALAQLASYGKDDWLK